MTPQDGPTPSEAERIRLAAADLAAAEVMDLGAATSASLVMMIVRLRSSLADTLRLLPHNDA